MGRFKTIQDVLDAAEHDPPCWTPNVTYAKELAVEYKADPNDVGVILECWENEALCQEEIASVTPDHDAEEVEGRKWWAGRLRAYAYMLRAFGVKPAYINWKGEAA